MTEDLLDTQDIANIYRVSYRAARDIITKKRGFPAPVPGSTRKKPLWLRKTVEAYLQGENFAPASHNLRANSAQPA